MPSWGERLLLVVVLAVFAGIVSTQIALGAPFEYDESVYAVQARAWVGDAPATGVGLHRAPLLPLLATPVAAVADTEAPFRILGLGLVLLTIVSIWWLGRTVVSPGAGLLAAAAFASSQHVLLRGGQFLTDIPAAGAMIAACALLYEQFERRDRPTRRLLLVAPLLAAAFYLRYGSALPVALIVLTTLLIWRRGAWANRALVVQTGALLLALLTPHLVHAVVETGKPWGVVTYTSTIAAQTEIGYGLGEYIRWLPELLAGRFAGTLIIAGLIWGVVAALMRRGRETRAAMFLVIPGVVQLVLLGIFIHPEPRFLFFTVGVLCVVGAHATTSLAARVPRRGVVVASILAALSLLTPVTHQATLARNRTEHLRSERGIVAQAGYLIRAEVPPGEDCDAVSMQVPMITWYARCETFHFGEPEEPDGRDRLLDARHRFIVLFHGDSVAPSPRVAARYRGIRGIQRLTIVGPVKNERFTGYEIYRLP